jgi:hypothetical protein
MATQKMLIVAESSLAQYEAMAKAAAGIIPPGSF